MVLTYYNSSLGRKFFYGCLFIILCFVQLVSGSTFRLWARCSIEWCDIILQGQVQYYYYLEIGLVRLRLGQIRFWHRFSFWDHIVVYIGPHSGLYYPFQLIYLAWRLFRIIQTVDYHFRLLPWVVFDLDLIYGVFCLFFPWQSSF